MFSEWRTNLKPLDLYPMVNIILRKEGVLFLLPGARRVAWLHLFSVAVFLKGKGREFWSKGLEKMRRGVRNYEGVWDGDYGELWCFEKASLRFLFKGSRLRMIDSFWKTRESPCHFLFLSWRLFPPLLFLHCFLYREKSSVETLLLNNIRKKVSDGKGKRSARFYSFLSYIKTSLS